MQDADLRNLRGVVATVVLAGTVQEEFAMCRENMRAYNVAHGFTNVEYRNVNAVLVEHGRDEICGHALSPNPTNNEAPYDFALQIDADATFPENALHRILRSAFISAPDSDVMGAYAQLRQKPHLPVLDTGSGTWEPHFPGEGVKLAIRTGGHFLLIKPRILTKFGPPWFRTRRAMRPVDALRDVDNYARIKMNGVNPLSTLPEWEQLMTHARNEAGGSESPVGEDSGFCDSVCAVGGKIYVDTDLVTGHISKYVITPEMLKQAKDEERARYLAAVGVYE